MTHNTWLLIPITIIVIIVVYGTINFVRDMMKNKFGGNEE